ncbi:hypothetical protein LTR49_010788 [Elasticomyces elasticus]|nr:hypothetical protein LTR49_010788 [Elasticomyces elasticus]
MSVWEHYLRIRRRMSSLNDMFSKLGMKRQEVERADSHLLDMQDLLTEKADALAVAFNNSTGDERADPSSLLQEYKDHLEYLKHYQQSAMELRRDLKRIEWRLHMKTDEVKTIILAASEFVPPEVWLECSLPSSRRESVVIPVEVDPILATYNACKLEWRRFRQALTNHKNTHAEEATQREIFMDRGEELDLPEEEWIESYQSRHERILDEIESARRDLAESAAQCNAAGIETDFDTLTLSLNGTRDAGPVSQDVVSSADITTPNIDEHHIDAFELKARKVDRVSIQDWVDRAGAEPI